VKEWWRTKFYRRAIYFVHGEIYRVPERYGTYAQTENQRWGRRTAATWCQCHAAATVSPTWRSRLHHWGRVQVLG